MSSPDRRTFVKLGLAATAALALSACFKPLYGPTASGQDLSTVLASITVDKVPTAVEYEEFANELRSELIYMLNGSGKPATKRYTLRMNFLQNVASPIIDSETGRATTSTVAGSIDFTLLDSDGKTVASQGRVQGMVTYERPAQRFASLRARRDAYNRLAKELAGHIKTRLALTFSGR